MTEPARVKISSLPWALRAFALVPLVSTFGYVVAVVLVPFNLRLALFVAIVAVALNLAKGQIVSFIDLDDADDSAGRLRPRFGRGGTAALVLTLLMLDVGAVAAVSNHTAGVYLLLGGLTARIGLDLTRGVAAYRDVMRRPWPAVAPLNDDDW